MIYKREGNRNWRLLILLATMWAMLTNLGGTAQGQIIVKFTALWCQPCQGMKSVDEKLRQGGIEVREVDCSEKVPQTFAPWVTRLPTYLAYDSKENYLGRQEGSCPLETLVALVKTPQQKITNSSSDHLIAQAYRWRVQSVLTGKQHPALQAAAQQHANYQARIGQQGHQNWDYRKQQVQSQLPGYNVEECAAESWSSSRRNVSEHASEMFNSWRQSPGHWEAVNGSCAYWGYAMTYSPHSQKWFAAALFANGRQQRYYASYQAPEQTEKPKKTNFIVYAQGVNQQASQQIADTAERLRRDLAIEWLGKEFPAWQNPCLIHVRVHSSLGGGGTTCFTFENGEVHDWRMSIQGSDVSTILGSVLPHEVTHTIFATHFRRPLPRWADEGGSTTMEMVSGQNKRRRGLAEYLQTGRGIPFEIMLKMTDYPQDILPLYAQGYSASSYLIEAGGRRQFIAFLEDSLAQSSYSKPLKTYYNLNSTRAFQESWLSWVRAGSPSAPQQQQVNYQQDCSPCNQWSGNQWTQQQPSYYEPTSQPQSPIRVQPPPPPPQVATVPKPQVIKGERGPVGEKGEQGLPGEPGLEGPPGKDAEIDYTKLAEEVAKRLPPIYANPDDKTGVHLGEVLPPFTAQVKDGDEILPGKRGTREVYLGQKLPLKRTFVGSKK